MPATRPSGYLLTKLRQQVVVVLDLRRVDRRPQFGRLALQRRRLRHHREVGRRLPGLGRLFELHQPGLAGRLGDRFDRDAGRLGEFREDVLVEGFLEVAAIDADLQRLVLRPQDRRHGEHAGGGKARRPARARRLMRCSEVWSSSFSSSCRLAGGFPCRSLNHSDLRPQWARRARSPACGHIGSAESTWRSRSARPAHRP